MLIEKWQTKPLKSITGLLLMLCALTLLSRTVQAQHPYPRARTIRLIESVFQRFKRRANPTKLQLRLRDPDRRGHRDSTGPSGAQGIQGPSGPSGAPGGSSGGPNLDLEGTVARADLAACGADGCPGDLTASLTGPPFQQLSLDMSVSVSATAGSDSCYHTTGFASINPGGNQSQVTFVGELCLPSFFTYLLKGTVNIIPVNVCPSTPPLMVSAGQLIAYGAVHTLGAMPTPGPRR